MDVHQRENRTDGLDSGDEDDHMAEEDGFDLLASLSSSNTRESPLSRAEEEESLNLLASLIHTENKMAHLVKQVPGSPLTSLRANSHALFEQTSHFPWVSVRGYSHFRPRITPAHNRSLSTTTHSSRSRRKFRSATH